MDFFVSDAPLISEVFHVIRIDSLFSSEVANTVELR